MIACLPAGRDQRINFNYENDYFGFAVKGKAGTVKADWIEI